MSIEHAIKAEAGFYANMQDLSSSLSALRTSTTTTNIMINCDTQDQRKKHKSQTTNRTIFNRFNKTLIDNYLMLNNRKMLKKKLGPVVLVSLLLLLVTIRAHCSAQSSNNYQRITPNNLIKRQVATNGVAEENSPTTTSPESTAGNEPEVDGSIAATTTASATSTSTSTTTTTQAPAPSNNIDQLDQPNKPKPIPPINFTMIDELFDAPLNDTEVAIKWKEFDKQLLNGVRGILKMIFPHVVAMSSDAKVSGACSGAILKWILNLRNLRTWAVKMLDATGKPGPGILEGSLSMLGNYRQCLEVRAPDEDEIELSNGEFKEYFRGQYCVLQIKPHLSPKPAFFSLNSTLPSLLRSGYKYYEKNVYDDLSELALAFNFVHIRADLCVPSLCSRSDIQRVANYLASKVDMRARVARCDYVEEAGITTNSAASAPPGARDVATSALDKSQTSWLIVIVIFGFLVFVSTVIHISLDSTGTRIGLPSSGHSRLGSLLSSMSLFKSWQYIRTVHLEQINDKRPIFLYAIKLGLLLWIFLVNLISQLDFQFMREMLPLRNMIMDLPMQFLVNSTLQFDALILITAFIYAYENINCNLTDLIKFNVARYSRLTPSIMLFVGLTCLTPLFYQNKSPLWHDFVDQQAANCKSNGLLNLLFIQNFLPYNQICLPQTWIFCVEMQLCILAIPLVYLLNRQFDTHHGRFKLESMPICLLILTTFFGCLFNFSNIYRNSLPPAWFLTYPDKQDKALYFEQHLYKTSTHLIAFATGLLCGHLCRCQSISNFAGKPYGRKSSQSVMMLTSFFLMVAIIFGTHSWSLSGRAHLDWPLASALYASLAPLGWSLAWCLLLFRLTVPNWSDKSEEAAGNLSSCLISLGPLLVRLGRLGFLAYLINPYVNTFVYAIQEQTIFSSIIMLAHTLIGNVFFTYLLALAVSFLVEIPARRLTKKILLGPRRQSTNFGIIARQLDIHHREMQLHGHGHNSFTGPPEDINTNHELVTSTNHNNKQSEKIFR